MNSIIKILKPSGLHHGLPVLIITWIIFLTMEPIAGVFTAAVAAGVFAILAFGFYAGKELKEAERRGFDPFKISTWTKDTFQRWDYTTPGILSTISVAVLAQIV